MVRYLIIFLLLSTSIYGQRIYRSSYEERIISSFNSSFMYGYNNSSNLIRYTIVRPIVITIRPFINQSVMQRLVSRDIDGFEMSDFMILGTYDIRVRIYLKKNLKLTTRALVSNNNQSYVGGLLIKF